MRQLGQAVKADTVDPSSFERSAGAMGAIGEAVARAGSVVGGLAAARIKARSDKAVLETEAEIEVANASLAKFMKLNRNNTALWRPEADRLTNEVLNRRLADPRLTEADKERLGLRLETWQKTTAIHADTQGAIADFGAVKADYQLKAIQAYDAGDKAGGDASIDAAVSGGYMQEADGGLLKFRGGKTVEAKADEERFNNLLLDIEEKPKELAGLIEAHNKTRPFNSAELLRLRRAEESALNRKRQEDNEYVGELFKTGQLKSADELAAFEYLSDGDRAEWKAQLEKPVLNNVGDYEQALGAIARYKASEDESGAKLAELRTFISKRFDTGFEQTLREKLDARVTPNAADVPTDAARALLDELVFEKGGLGQWKTPRIAASTGGPVYEEKTLKSIRPNGRKKEEVVHYPVYDEDPVKKAALGEKVKAIQAEVDQAIKRGEVTTATEAKALMLKLYTKAGGAAPITSMDENNPLLPPITNPDQRLEELLK
jgi:hypothetical protein